MPGCTSRRNLHDHQICFRSAGGPDPPGNRITLCAFHDQRCLHAGLLRVSGRAPEGLLFELGLRPGAPRLACYRSGDIGVADRLAILDAELAERAAGLAADRGLRGADAVYVAVAGRLGLPLVRLDREQPRRADRVVEVGSVE